MNVLAIGAASQAGRACIGDVTAPELERIFRTNVLARFQPCKAALLHMKSGATCDPLPSLFDHAFMKGAVATFTKALAEETTEPGIQANAAAPGPVWTPVLPVSVLAEITARPGEQESPPRRPGQPAEIVAGFVFLFSQETSYGSGAILGVTAGRPLV
jgi:NAD(P)-dependent dehydrogenase (short-subunit alcohol dehydrogenase family)